jgi:hypothetical protein
VSDQPELTPLQHATLVAVLEHSTYTEACAKVGIDRKTLFVWLKHPAFAKALRQARHAVIEEVVGEIGKAAKDALAALRRNLTCGVPAAEVRAAAVILDKALGSQQIANLEAEMLELKALLEARRSDGEPESGEPVVGTAAPEGPGTGDESDGPDPRDPADAAD